MMLQRVVQYTFYSCRLGKQQTKMRYFLYSTSYFTKNSMYKRTCEQ